MTHQNRWPSSPKTPKSHLMLEPDAEYPSIHLRIPFYPSKDPSKEFCLFPWVLNALGAYPTHSPTRPPNNLTLQEVISGKQYTLD